MKDTEALNIIKKIPITIDQDINDIKLAKHNHNNIEALNLLDMKKIDLLNTIEESYKPDHNEPGHTHKNMAALNEITTEHVNSLKTLKVDLSNKADKSHTHKEYQEKILNKGLSEEDFTSAYKIKLDELKDFNGTFETLSDKPDISKFIDDKRAVELIQQQINISELTLSGYVKKEEMLKKADKDHIHKNYEDQLSLLLTTIGNKADKDHVHINYQEKEEGKGLSQENFTTQNKTDLTSLIENSQKNIEPTRINTGGRYNFVSETQMTNWDSKATGEDISSAITNFKVNIDKTIDQQVSAIVDQKVIAFSKQYVKKDGEKGLSTNDFTTAEKLKLAGIEEGANACKHPEKITSRDIYIEDQKTLDQAINDGTLFNTMSKGVSEFFLDSFYKNRDGDRAVSIDYDANRNKSFQLISPSQNFVTFKLNANDVLLGKNSITIRAKSSNNIGETNIADIEVSVKRQRGAMINIKTIKLNANKFKPSNTYSLLTSTFDYGVKKEEGDEFLIRVKTLSPSISISLDYILLKPIIEATTI